MAEHFWSGEKSRRIFKRVVVEGDLVLHTPAHFGNGDGFANSDDGDLTDMPLLVDPYDGKRPLLTGASIAGAMRSYLREVVEGYREKEKADSASAALFGVSREAEGVQSPLVIDDALAKPETYGIEIRDGVRIDPKSRTAADKAKFDLQLWRTGTTFPLRFELLICAVDKDGKIDWQKTNKHEEILKSALATALQGFNDGGISLGARKRRGYGRVKVNEWRIKEFDLKTKEGLLDWLGNGEKKLESSEVRVITATTKNLKENLGVEKLLDDKRCCFSIEAEFSLNGSLLIRSGGGKDDRGPDMVHLFALQANNEHHPILSGTSLGGALRARALKIANTVGRQKKARALIDEMFGVEIRQGVKPSASRIIVREHIVRNAKTELVQNRVSIDRFTGGARDTALFNEQPVFGGELIVDLQLANPKACEIGLLLLLLKDLWTGDLPLGGESSVGRGRLKGKKATLIYRNKDDSFQWDIAANDNGLTAPEEARDRLESYVAQLNSHLKETAA